MKLYSLFSFRLCLITLAGFALTAQAAEIKVDSLSDSGPGSLREAVSGAASGDTILIRAEGVIDLSWPITVRRDLTIAGQNGPLLHTIRSGSGRLFEIPRNRTVVISRLTLADGSAADNGGLVHSEGDLTLEGVRLVGGNAGGKGGAIFQKGGNLAVDRCLFDGNAASTGGAIGIENSTAILSANGFSSNSATDSGGAVHAADSTLTITNSALHENSAPAGGAVALYSGEGRLVNLTLSANDGLSGKNAFAGAGAVLEIGNTLIADPAGFATVSGEGTLLSLGNNLSDGPAADWISSSDVSGTDTGLGTAADFGGVSASFPLLPGSPAIDGGNNALAGGSDQRGLSRFSDGDADGGGRIVDIGAFEIQLYTVSSLQIFGSSTGGEDDGGYGNPYDPSDDAGSISSADVFTLLTEKGKADIGDAVGANNAAGGGAIGFHRDIVPGRLALKGSELEIRRNIAIYGPGADRLAIDGDGRSRVINISGGASAYLYGISVENGSADSGSGIRVEADSELELEAVSLSSNLASLSGGGIELESGRTYVYRSALIGNSAGQGGGAVAASAGTTLHLDNSTVSGNHAGLLGGAVHTGGETWITSSTFSGNTASDAGPGIYADVTSSGHIRNSILHHGNGPALVAAPGSSFFSAGFNISEGEEPLLTGPGDRFLTDPRIGRLSLNGGSTLSHAPAPDGPAINSGNTDAAAFLDQPGFPRIRGNAIDIGSVEFQNDGPVIDCPVPVILECTSSSDTPVVIEASVDDVDGDPFTVEWKLNGILFATDTVGSGATLPAELSQALDLPMGDYTVTLIAEDSYGASSTCIIPVSIADTTAPVVTLVGDTVLNLECGDLYTEAGATASDACDSSVVAQVVESDLPASGILSTGTYTVTYAATDSSGNTGSASRTISVSDTTEPVLTLSGDNSVTLECGVDTWSDPGATASDGCEGDLAVSRVIYSGGTEASGISTAMPGSYSIVYSATDSSGNTATTTRTVVVEDTIAPVVTAPGDFTQLTDPGFCSAQISFAATATDNCTVQPVITYTILANEEYPTATAITSPYDFPPGVHTVQCTATDASGNASNATFQVTVTDDFLNCVQNTSWPNALPLDLQADETGGAQVAQVQQFLALTDQARWYRFNVQPGSRVTVILSDLPANYDIVVYRDIEAEYQRLLDLFTSTDPETQELALLGVEFAPESFSPESFSPESFSPESFSPESFSPESFSPESFSPESFSPESFSPESFSPESFSPESFSPESFSPESFSPESFSPESFSPESFSPESFSPESFSAAQVSSMIAYSAFPGVASEGVAINTFTRSGDFYVRVRGSNGAYSIEAPFKVTVVEEPEICDGLEGPESFGQATLAPDAGGYETILLWDRSRLDGTIEELDALDAKLQTLASQPEVKGVVVDVSLEDRVMAANLQADSLPACPFSKNLVAEEIKDIIDGYRALNPGLRYVGVMGNDDVIPFFRMADEAFLAPELNYVPPVIDSTHSQSSLRYGQILTQDPYGASCEINLVTGQLWLPELAVGRLVESVEDISRQIDNYLSLADGILPQPATALSTGYDFLDDVARAVQFEFEAALGSPVDSLIADSTLSPSEGWTSAELAEILLGSRHDLVFLAGHFSTGSALAADYASRLTAAQVLASGADFKDTVVFSAGCHSGYNTVDAHAINGITKQPDWAQAFAGLGAIFIAGTGYQYGDTEFIEYSERLYLEFSRQLRTGAGAISIGEALVKAKRKYLAETPLMRGIHEKSLVQTTLFGLPMIRLDVPGERLVDSSTGEDAGVNPTGYTTDPGLTLGLERAELQITPQLVRRELDLVNIEDNSIVTAEWFEGRHGFVTNPAEPTRPLESYLVSVPGTLLRGVGFRGGDYLDYDDFLPLTGAPTTEIRGVYGNFFSEVWYPVQPFSLNYFGTLCGGTDGNTRLNVYPAQYLADGGGVIGGIMRTYENMDFRLYYNNNREIYDATGVPSIPALAAPPSIAQVRSEANLSDTEVTFLIRILGNPAAGLQEAWITYTGIPGSVLHGAWRSVDLVQDSVDSTLWKAVLPLNGAVSDEVRFMVQAVSGTGLVALSTNFGRYYEVGVDELASRIASNIELINPPANGAYGESVPVQARLTSEGEPLSGVRIGFRVGTAKISGFTDVDGIASVLLPLNTRPDESLLLQAYFQGDREVAPSATSSRITVVKQPTRLDFNPVPADPFGADIVVALSDSLGTPLKERTVFFLVDYGTFQIGNAVITDFSGRADLSEIDLPGGDVTITAYFNGTIPLPDADPVTIPDDLYLPAVKSIDVVLAEPILEDSLGFDAQQVDIHYKSTGSKGKTATAPVYENASVSGEVAFNVPLQPGQLLASPDSPVIEATVEARLSGQLIAAESMLLDTRGDNGNHWTTARRPDQEVSFLAIHWSKSPRFDSRLSGSPGPRIYTTFIGNNFSELHFEPVAGTYETRLPGGRIISVKNGIIQVNGSSALLPGDYTIDENGALTLVVNYGIEPGMTFVTTAVPQGDLIASVAVLEDVNYLLEGGRMIVRLVAQQDTPRPPSDAFPDLLEVKIVIGCGEGETEVRSSARIGDGLGAVQWSSEDPNHKQYRP